MKKATGRWDYGGQVVCNRGAGSFGSLTAALWVVVSWGSNESALGKKGRIRREFPKGPSETAPVLG